MCLRLKSKAQCRQGGHAGDQVDGSSHTDGWEQSWRIYVRFSGNAKGCPSSGQSTKSVAALFAERVLRLPALFRPKQSVASGLTTLLPGFGLTPFLCLWVMSVCIE